MMMSLCGKKRMRRLEKVRGFRDDDDDDGKKILKRPSAVRGRWRFVFDLFD